MIIHQRYKWKVTGVIDEPWVLESYDGRCLTTSWNICDETSCSHRGIKGDKYYHQTPISQQQVPWLMDFSAGQDLLEEIWMSVEDAESGYHREATDLKIEKTNAVQKRKIDLVMRGGKKTRYDRG